jgi:type I restriction enzyme S subunit
MGSAGVTGYHNKALVKGPGVTIGRSGVGSMGVVNYCQEDYWPHNTVLYVTDFKGNYPLFAYYFLKSMDLRSFDSGSAQASLNRNYLYPTIISIPSYNLQKDIADFLFDLEKKVELNNATNRTLESMARAVFHQWFVDSPQAKWEIKPFGEIIEFFKGKKPEITVNESIAGFLPLILIEMLDTGKSPYANPEKMIVAEQNNVLMVMDGASSGRVEIGHHGIVGSTIAMIRCKENTVGDYFLYYSLKEKEADSRENLTGTSIPHMDKQWLFRQTTCLPDQNRAREFEEFARNIRMKIQANLRESRTLGSLRDSLLPKLMRGEVRVSEL